VVLGRLFSVAGLVGLLASNPAGLTPAATDPGEPRACVDRALVRIYLTHNLGRVLLSATRHARSEETPKLGYKLPQERPGFLR
jgi:hypothetical protein